MSAVIEVCVEGIGVWGPGLAGWTNSQAALRGDAPPDLQSEARLAPSLLPPTERRRAPATVLLALQVASEACAMAGRDPAHLPSVFGSTQGDIAISDTMCRTLAQAPHELSPIKFHNSVHNAAVGYWTIATGCHAASNAVSAWRESFGATLFEAAMQALDLHCAVLMVVYDSVSVGPLRKPIQHDIDFASALVLSPVSVASRGAALQIQVAPHGASTPARTAWAQAMQARNGSAACLPMLELLAGATPGELRIATGPQQAVTVKVTP